jgi:hypothetical protein
MGGRECTGMDFVVVIGDTTEVVIVVGDATK